MAERISLSESVVIHTVSEEGKSGVFEVEGLSGGYGLTVGTALRRTLLSSITGAAVTQLKLKGASHEFTTLPGVLEDVVELMMNFKKVRFRMFTDEPQTLLLKKKGEGTVTAADIKANAQVAIVNPDVHIATLTEKGSDFDVELLIEAGRGYVPAEARRVEKLPIGVVALDAIFSPVVKVNFSVEHMRVGEKTDYDRLRVAVETDGSISPSFALQHAAEILKDHFSKIAELEVREIELPKAAVSVEGGKEKPKRAKKAAGKKKE